MKVRGRLALGVFVIAWMNATLQPCLMAMELPPDEPASIPAVAGHDGHQNHPAKMLDHADKVCPHCPSTTSHDGNSCAVTVTRECGVLPEAKPADRILKADLSDAFDDGCPGHYYHALERAPPLRVATSISGERPTFVVGPTINIRNCVFLK